MPLAKNKIIPLSVESLSSDGSGVGRHEGQVVFVPGAAPGDVLRVKIVKMAKHHAYGRIEQVVTPGPGRVKPDCPATGRCGGCSFRHLSYEAELAAKQGFVEDALRRIGGLEVSCETILPSPLIERYRNKVQYPVAAGPEGALTYGFYASRSHRPVPCDDCLLQPQELNAIAGRTVALLERAGATAYDETAHTGIIRHVCLRQGEGTGDILLCIVATNGALPRREEICAALMAEFPALKGITLNVNPRDTNVIFGSQTLLLYGEGEIDSVLAGVPQRLGPLSFSQVNPLGAQRLFEVAQQFAGLTGNETLLDLYCGAGVIGLSMAHACKSLIGVELHAPSILNARESAKKMDLDNTRFICGDAGKAAAELLQEGLRPDVAVLDPPRKGAGADTLAALRRMGPRRVVMVSCNPATLARDLQRLSEAGYRLQKVQPVDMFPRTRHVEAVALLERG